MKAILEMDKPEKCLDCMVSWYEVGDDGERLMCLPLSHIKDEEVEGEYLKCRDDCPLKELKE